ncbi:MAG: D-alanine--poly(phosphoribitol) ligase subunit DltC [Clostridiales bacterium]|nr:D-alanine--poly(phosphoribitol) ligase subunit DltC [Clostridiales bacterium]
MEEKLLDILEEICGDSVVKEDQDVNLVDEGLMDSLDFTELIVAIEKNFGVIIPPSEVTREESDTPNKIIGIVRERL